MTDYEKIFIKFAGKDIKDKSIPIDYLGKFLRPFQMFFLETARINTPNLKKNWLRLVLTNIEPGSAVAVFELKSPNLLMPKTYKESTNTTKNIFEIIQQEDSDAAHAEFQKKVKKTATRITLYRYLKNVWSTKKITNSIGIGDSLEATDFVDLKVKYKKRIQQWLKKEFHKEMVSIKGFLTRIKADDVPQFTVINEFGVSIVVHFDLEDLPRVKDLLTKPVILKGIMETSRGQKTIKSFVELKELINIKIEKTKSYNLKKPLLFTLKYFEDGVLASEEYIPLNLDLEVLADLEIELDSYLEFLEETYIKQDIKNLTPKAQQLRERLIQLIVRRLE